MSAPGYLTLYCDCSLILVCVHCVLFELVLVCLPTLERILITPNVFCPAGTADYSNNLSKYTEKPSAIPQHIVSGVYWSDEQSNYVNNSASPSPKRLLDNFTGEYDRPRSKQEVVTPITSRDIATGVNNFIAVE